MQDIFLSPHYDDIAFSLSSFLHKNDIIINIFTESNYVENKSLNLTLSVSKIRETEERNFTSKNNLKYIKLGFQDRNLVGAPFSFFHTIKENIALEKILIESLIKLKSFDNQQLYCPLGVGKHYNHLETFNIIYKNYSYLAKFFKILFYADVPYIFYKNNYQNRMKYLHTFFQQYGLTARVIKLNEKEVTKKVNNLKLYESQFACLNESYILERIGGIKKDFKEIVFS